MKKVGIRDVTFREGDDCVGNRVSVEDKIETLRLAVEMGVEEIDIGGPSMHVHQYEFGKAVTKPGIKVRVIFLPITQRISSEMWICA